MKSNPGTRSSNSKLHPADWVVQSGAVDDVLELLKTKLAKRRRRRAANLAGVAAMLCCIAAFWAVPYLRHTQTIATPSAQRQTLTLADGSRADLNARSALFTDFRGGRRIVRLDRGEAFFVVAKDAEHPFLVETPAGTVRVTGTEFNVRIAAGGAAQVTLVEGAVEISRAQNSADANSSSGAVALTPGQQATIAGADAAVRTLTRAEVERATAWRTGRALFDGETLAEAAERFATFHGVTIELESAIATLRVGGSYPLHELREFLHAVEATMPVKIVTRGEGNYHLRKQ